MEDAQSFYVISHRMRPTLRRVEKNEIKKSDAKKLLLQVLRKSKDSSINVALERC